MNNMIGKVCLVTGANAGMGKVTARELAQMGATVIMVARSQVRGEAALDEIRQASNSDKVQLLLADLSSMASIRELADTVQANYGRLDVLVNNAGGIFNQREVSVDGYEMTFALNHLNYFLLTNLLLDLLKASAPARIVNVASTAHVGAKIHFDDIMMAQKYRSFEAYGQSKLANILFTYELARRLAGSGVTANALHPGGVATEFATGQGFMGWIFKLIRPFLLTPEQGAQTQIYLASSPDVEGISGKYFAKKKPVQSSKISYDTAVAQRLWQLSEELTGLA
ncbi:MAG: SDR family oxidoreductase [Anaerolineales bacterium]|nr:SDR family oxidoreductase [Anaerolineales bacterium]